MARKHFARGESPAKIAYEISRISEIPQNFEGISGGISLDFKKFDIDRYVLQLNPFCKHKRNEVANNWVSLCQLRLNHLKINVAVS